MCCQAIANQRIRLPRRAVRPTLRWAPRLSSDHAVSPRLDIGRPGRDRARGRRLRPQLPPVAGRDRSRPRRVGVGRRRAPLPRLHERLLGGQPWPPAPAARRGAPGAAREGGGDIPGLPHHRARAVPREALRRDRLRAGAPDEHRRRSGRDRDQGGPPLGPPGQGNPRRPGRDPRRDRQLPRPHDDDHQLLVRGELQGRLRAAHARLPDLHLRRPGLRGVRRHARDVRDPRRADPGRGRDRAAARGLPARPARPVRPPRDPAHPRRDPVRTRPHGPHVRLRARGDPARRTHPRQGARRRPAAGVGVPGRRARHGRLRARQPRLDVRRQPAGRRGRARRARGARGRGARRAERRPRSPSRGAPGNPRRAGDSRDPRGRPVGRGRIRSGAGGRA